MVTEHESTIQVIRDELTAQITERLYSQQHEFTHHNWAILSDVEKNPLDKCTVLQLRSLWNNFVSLNTPIKLHHCNPADHLSLTAFGMYVGIEPDGHTHS